MGFIRIIGGEKKGHRIRVLPGRKIRPMAERAREAAFNIFGDQVEGRPVLDLFAGTGALGLEALSRGAKKATFVEIDPKVVQLIKENAKRLGMDDRVEVVRADVFRWVHRPGIWPKEPALVFVAPPYALYRERLPLIVELWRELVEHLPEETILLFQLNRKFDVSLLPPGQDWDVRVYGQVRNAICWLTKERRESEEDSERA